MSDLHDELGTDIGHAIDQAISQREHGIATKWVALVETIGPDGDQGLWTFVNHGIASWEIKGFLLHALDLEQAKAVTDRLEGP